ARRRGKRSERPDHGFLLLIVSSERPPPARLERGWPAAIIRRWASSIRPAPQKSRSLRMRGAGELSTRSLRPVRKLRRRRTDRTPSSDGCGRRPSPGLAGSGAGICDEGEGQPALQGSASRHWATTRATELIVTTAV